MAGKFMESFIALSAWLLLLFSVVGAEELGQMRESDLLGFSRVDSFDKRFMLEKRACDPGYFSCGNGYCAPNGGTCCADGYYAKPGWYCCPDGSGYSAPVGALCCPGTGYYARPGYYCCSDYGSCQNGETCFGCTAVAGESTGGPQSPLPSSTPPAVTSSTPPPSTPSVMYQYYTITVTYYYISWSYYLTTLTSTRVTTTTEISVYAPNSAAAESSVDQMTATISFYTPPAPNSPTPTATRSVATVATESSTTTTSTSTSTVVSFPGAAARVQAAEGVWTLPVAWIFVQLANVVLG